MSTKNYSNRVYISVSHFKGSEAGKVKGGEKKEGKEGTVLACQTLLREIKMKWEKREGGQQGHNIKRSVPEEINEKTRVTKRQLERKEKEGRVWVLPSSSNCVSTPDGPGTEQTSLALRKVVQRLIRLLLPPTSFWTEGEKTGWRTMRRKGSLANRYNNSQRHRYFLCYKSYVLEETVRSKGGKVTDWRYFQTANLSVDPHKYIARCGHTKTLPYWSLSYRIMSLSSIFFILQAATHFVSVSVFLPCRLEPHGCKPSCPTARPPPPSPWRKSRPCRRLDCECQGWRRSPQTPALRGKRDSISNVCVCVCVCVCVY